jgi:hypothetical protein
MKEEGRSLYMWIQTRPVCGGSFLFKAAVLTQRINYRKKEEVYICGFRQGTFVGEASSSKLPSQLKG